MTIFLPPEILSQVILAAVVGAEDLSKVAQFRLVNRYFDQEVLRAYAKTNILNRKVPSCHKDPEADTTFLAKFLLQRPLSDLIPVANFWSLINSVIDDLFEYGNPAENNDDLRFNYIRRLTGFVGGVQPLRKVIPLIFAPDPLPEKHDGVVALVAAAYLGRVDIIEKIFRNDEIKLADMKSPTLGTPMYAAMEAGDHKSVKALLDNGVDPNLEIAWRCFPLTHAMSINRNDLMHLLLEPQYGLNTSNRVFEEAIEASIRKNRPQVTCVLLDHGTGSLPDSEYLLSTALRKACEFGMVKVVKLLLDNGGDPDEHLSRQQVGLPPLVGVAAWAGHEEVLRLLLEYGAEVREDSRHILFSAAWGVNVNCMRILIDADIRANAFGDDIFGHCELLEILLNSERPGVSIGEFTRLLQDRGIIDVRSLCGKRGADLIAMACRLGSVEFLQVLHEYGVNLNDDPMYQFAWNAPLIVLAKSREQDKAVEFLLSTGVKDVNPHESSLADLYAKGYYPCKPHVRHSSRMPWNCHL